MNKRQQRSERCPVVDATQVSMWDFEYQAKRYVGHRLEIKACDSLRKLKSAVRENGWKLAWITTRHGCLSYGQNSVDEYPYRPR